MMRVRSPCRVRSPSHGMVRRSAPFIIQSAIMLCWGYLRTSALWCSRSWDFPFSFHRNIMSQESARKSVGICCPSYQACTTWRLVEIVCMFSCVWKWHDAQFHFFICKVTQIRFNRRRHMLYHSISLSQLFHLQRPRNSLRYSRWSRMPRENTRFRWTAHNKRWRRWHLKGRDRCYLLRECHVILEMEPWWRWHLERRR